MTSGSSKLPRWAGQKTRPDMNKSFSGSDRHADQLRVRLQAVPQSQ